MPHVLKGKTFRSPVADANPTWKVLRQVRPGVFECEAVDDPDFAGVTKRFLREEIEGRMEWEAAWAVHMAKHEAFYQQLELGTVVHYHNAFGQFVRAEVVVAEDVNEHDHPCIEVGERCLRYVALVGSWKGYDLRPGSYHWKAVKYGARFKPNAGCIYENPASSVGTREHGDPAQLEALELPEAV